jgi:hypothetical protein
MAHKLISESTPMAFNFRLYRLAELARQKLLHHASQTDHDLRFLVLHANLLDTLLLELNDESPSSKMADRDTLPTLAAHHARLHGSRDPVILVTESNENARDDDEDSEDDEEPQTFLSLRASAGSPPMLSHDSDSGSEYSSSDDSDDSEHEDDLEVEPSSPTSSISDEEGVRSKPEEKNSGLGLHRALSNWRLPQLRR